MDNHGPNQTTTDPLTGSQLAALIRLLSDDDPEIHKTVREKLLGHGPSVRNALKPCLLDDDPVLRRRAREIIRHFDCNTADNRFLAFCLKQGQDFDLEHALWLLAQTEYPDINIEAYQAQLDDYARILRERVVMAGDALQILRTINQFLYGELEFRGNRQNYYDPDNSYLNKVMDRRSGIPISLCMIFLFLARRLRLPVSGVGLPGHFVCRFQNSTEEYYIDCFNRGRILSKADCMRYLISANFDLEDNHLTPLNARRILMRACGNLHRIYYHLKRNEEITRFQRYLVALAR
jgi:regulator of sirC expression with transglutaminase-like and TPR domain